MMNSRIKRLTLALLTVGIVTLTACSSGTAASTMTAGELQAGEKYKVALSLSYTGNDWQDAAANLVKAQADTEPYKSKVDLTVDIAGSEVTKQIQTLNNEISAGVDAIILYAISPTALNATIEKACAKGIVVMAYDSIVTAPCAYNVHIDQYEHGTKTATWLAEELKGKGTIANVTGVPGTSVSTDRQKALADVLKKYPGITIAGSARGDWNQALGKAAFESIQSAHPDVDGVFAETGCFAITQAQVSAGEVPLPCAGEYTNGHHLYMLPESMGGVGLRSASAASAVYSGELAFINAIKVLEGGTVGKNIILPLPYFTTDDVNALGAKAVGLDPSTDGSLMLPAGTVEGGFFDGYWSPLVEQGYKAAMTGTSNKISTALSCSNVPGCIENDQLTLDSNHSGGN